MLLLPSNITAHNVGVLYIQISLSVFSFPTRRAAQRLELQGVQAYSNIDGLQGLHTLPTAIVDYKGVRLSAQGLAPGLEASDQDQGASPASR